MTGYRQRDGANPAQGFAIRKRAFVDICAERSYPEASALAPHRFAGSTAPIALGRLRAGEASADRLRAGFAALRRRTAASLEARVNQAASVVLPEATIEVIASLAEHRALSTGQVHTIHLPGRGLRRTQQLLADLERAELIGHVEARSAPRRLWFLSERGADLLVEVGELKEHPKLLGPKEAAGPLRAHTFAVNEVGISFLEAARKRGDEFGPVSWRHEIAHPMSRGRGRSRRTLFADAVLTYLLLKETQIAIEQRLVELDRATLSVDRLVSELSRYAQLYRAADKRDEPLWRSRYAVFPRIILRAGRHLSLAFKAHLLSEAREQREALEAGADLRDERGRRVTPLGPVSIKMILDAFAAVLDEAIEDEHRGDNPARSKRMHIKVPKPKRTFLEMDELAALLDAAQEQDVGLPDLAALEVPKGGTPEKVARLAATGKRPQQIAVELGLAKGTVSYHLRRLGIDMGRGYAGRRVVCEILGRAGLRASGLCDLKIGQVRLHGPNGARLRIEEAKTDAGERIVELTPDLAEAIVEHIDRLRQAGMPTRPDDYLVPNARGGRSSRKRIGGIVAAAAKLASERLVARGLPPLPKTTPHTLRRTYISIALLANEFDVKWVMDQVGHADSAMTMDVYAQLQQRAERRHGANFDRLVRKAREQLAGTAIAA